MKKYTLLIASLFLFCSFLQNSGLVNVGVKESESDSISLVFAGDIMGHSPQYKAAYSSKTNSFNYDVCFELVKKHIEAADLAICNLEVPIAGKPYSGYPNFSSPDALLDGLKNAGYDILLTANNHVLDRGRIGMERTIRQIEKRKLLHSGSYIDLIQRDSIYPLVVNVKGVKVAFLNYTYGTNTHIVEKPNIVNYIDSLQIISDLHKADKLGADFKIMTLHWGTEYELQANETQRSLAQFFVNNGVNLVIGSHPHVVQNAEILYNKDSVAVPVFYSLGNSLSNQRKLNTNGGIMVDVVINAKTKKIKTTSFLPVYVYRGVLNTKYQYHLIPTTDYMSQPAKFDLHREDSISLVEFNQLTMNRLNNIKLFNN